MEISEKDWTMKKYTFRYNNWENYMHPEGTYEQIIQFCGMYEIPIKYVGRSKKHRCHWLEITVGALTASLLKGDPHWELYKVK